MRDIIDLLEEKKKLELKALPYADTVEKIEALLPWNFKKMTSAE